MSVSADGRRLVYAAFARTTNVWSVPIPAHGSVSVSRAQPVTSGSQEIEQFDVSADGRWLAFDSDRGGGNQQLYRVPLAGGDVEQLTSGDEPALAPVFSPDGREIVYHSFRNGFRQLFVMALDGGKSVQVTAGNDHSRAGHWSPDGRSLTFSAESPLSRRKRPTS